MILNYGLFIHLEVTSHAGEALTTTTCAATRSTNACAPWIRDKAAILKADVSAASISVEADIEMRSKYVRVAGETWLTVASALQQASFSTHYDTS